MNVNMQEYKVIKTFVRIVLVICLSGNLSD
jgi:hypothetical protein